MKKIKFALIGLGYFGKHYLRLLQQIEGVEIKTVCNRSPEAFEKYSELLLPSIKRVARAEDIFSDPEIDAVVIATPTPSHFELASSALEAGKHVLLEKPMTRTLGEAEILTEIARKSGKVFMVGHQYLYNDHILFLKEKIDQGFFGKIFYFYAEHFYTKPLMGFVGCFWETSTHELAILDFLFGPCSIEKKLARFENFFGQEKDDFASVSFSLSGKFPVMIASTWCAPEKVRRFTIVGERGSAVFDEVRDIKNPLQLYETKDASGEYREVPVEIANTGEPLKNQLHHFLECIQGKSIPRTGYDHGLRVTRYLDSLSQ